MIFYNHRFVNYFSLFINAIKVIFHKLKTFPRRYMDEILPIGRKTLSNLSIHQCILYF